MSLRYLFGPVSADFVSQNLGRERAAGRCLAFDETGSTDLAVGPADTWEGVLARLPDGWRPDFVVLHACYRTVPGWLWSAPVPLVAWAPDWNLLWHAYRRRLRCCERVLTDRPGVERLAREGIAHGHAANLFACEAAFVEGPWPEGERDIDVLFVGNLHNAVQRERLAWLGRLAGLGRRWRVAIETGVFGEDYRRLLGRARVVFNRSIRGECNRRAFEAAAAGALLFTEAGNAEVPLYFRDGQECVGYDDHNLEALLAHYLEHEDERRALAEAARARVREHHFEDLWAEQVAGVERDWPDLVARAARRPALTGTEDLLARTWQALSSSDDADAGLVPDLTAAVAARPDDSGLHNALGLAVARTTQGRGHGPLPPGRRRRPRRRPGGPEPGAGPRRPRPGRGGRPGRPPRPGGAGAVARPAPGQSRRRPLPAGLRPVPRRVGAGRLGPRRRPGRGAARQARPAPVAAARPARPDHRGRRPLP